MDNVSKQTKIQKMEMQGIRSQNFGCDIPTTFKKPCRYIVEGKYAIFEGKYAVHTNHPPPIASAKLHHSFVSIKDFAINLLAHGYQVPETKNIIMYFVQNGICHLFFLVKNVKKIMNETTQKI
jgi:hypothetical protein